MIIMPDSTGKPTSANDPPTRSKRLIWRGTASVSNLKADASEKEFHPALKQRLVLRLSVAETPAAFGTLSWFCAAVQLPLAPTWHNPTLSH
jgi:hypothetical protein